MKRARVLIIGVLLLATMVAAAQELTETSTVGPITVSYPAGFTTQEIMPGAVAVVDPSDSLAVLIFSGDAIIGFGLPAGLDAAALIEVLPSVGEVMGEPQTLDLPNGTATSVEVNIADVGAGVLFVMDTDNGVLIAMALAREGTLPDEFKATAEAIVGSVSVAAGEAAPTDTPEEPETTATPGKGEDTDSTPTTGIDGETCPIPVEDMPENTVVFCPGVTITLPDNWSLIEGTTEVDTFASINRENFTVSLSTTVNEISPFYNPESYTRDVLPFIADTVGHTTFDPNEHLVTAFEEPGYKAVFYDPADFVDDLEEGDVRQLVYIITLNDDLFVTHTFTWVPSFSGEGVETEIELVVMSTQLADFYDGTPAITEIDGETVFVHEATWSDSTYSFRFNEEPVLIVVCPPGGEGNEGSVWGTDVYTHDSAICLAAAHAGAISLSDGGTVKVTMQPGEESYTGSTANGVTSMDYGPWTDSYTVEPFELE